MDCLGPQGSCSCVDDTERPAAGEIAVRSLRGQRQVIVQVSGDVDMFTEPQLASGVQDAIASGSSVIVVDLTMVSFFSAAGIRCLESALSAVQAQGSTLCLVCPDAGPARRILHLLDLDREWPLYPALADAIRATPI